MTDAAINSANIGHADGIRKLVNSLSHFYLSDAGAALPEWLESTLSKESFEQRITDSSYQNYVYEIDKNIIGYIALSKEQHLYHLFVSAEHHGNGIARKLWRYAINRHPNDYYTVRSSLFAVPVYKRLGFVESGSVGYKDGVGFQPMEFRHANDVD